MDRDGMFAAITAQRRRLADALEPLGAAEWDAPSLCTGWRVRDVAGHLVSILEIPMPRFLLGVAKARSFDRYAARVGREFGVRPPSELVDALRRHAESRFTPPFIGPIAPLTDVLVHTRDIGRPLGWAVDLDPDALRAALGYVGGGRARGFIPAKRTKGLRFEAPDLDWSVGDGALVVGPGEALLLAVTGRRAALADCSGEGAALLGARLG